MLAVGQPMRDISLNSRISVQILQKKLKQSCLQQVGNGGMDWVALLQTAKIVELPADMLVLQPSSPCSEFMLVIEGSVRVYQQNPDDREITLYRNHCGDLCVLSINGMLHRKAFGAFAKTETKVLALSLSREQFMKTMAVMPAFCEFVLTNLTDRINDVLEIIEKTVFENLDTRLMCFLGRLSRETSSDTLRLTHQDLARELGSSREVVSRILKALERQGCIAQERGVIRLTL